MTAPSIPARGDRWLRAIGYGLLAEIATIITIIFVVMFYKYVLARGLPEGAYTLFGERAGALIGILGGALYTFSFARLLMRRISSNFIAHGIVSHVMNRAGEKRILSGDSPHRFCTTIRQPGECRNLRMAHSV